MSECREKALSQLNIRCTHTALCTLQRAARRAGLTLSKYLLSVGLARAVQLEEAKTGDDGSDSVDVGTVSVT